MAKKRASAQDALLDIAPPQEPRQEEKLTKQERHRRYGKPATYRLPEDLIDRLKEIADTERVKISDLATFALQTFVRDYEAGDIVLPKTEPARYSLDIE